MAFVAHFQPVLHLPEGSKFVYTWTVTRNCWFYRNMLQSGSDLLYCTDGYMSASLFPVRKKKSAPCSLEKSKVQEPEILGIHVLLPLWFCIHVQYKILAVALKTFFPAENALLWWTLWTPIFLEYTLPQNVLFYYVQYVVCPLNTVGYRGTKSQICLTHKQKWREKIKTNIFACRKLRKGKTLLTLLFCIQDGPLTCGYPQIVTFWKTSHLCLPQVQSNFSVDEQSLGWIV